MRLFKPRTAVVVAEQVSFNTAEELVQQFGAQIVKEIDPFDSGATFIALNVPTLEGVKRASQGDWVVRVSGGVRVIKPAQFEALYEAI